MGSPAPSRGGASASPPPATRVDVHVHLRAFANLDLLERGWYAVRCVALNGDDARRSFALVDSTPVGRPRPAARREKQVPSCGGDVGDDDDALASGAPPLGEVLEGARWGDARARARASSADASDVAPGRYTTRAFPVMYARESFPVDRLVRFATRVAAEREDEVEEDDAAAGSAPARPPPRAKPGTPRSPSVPSTVALEFELLRAPIPDDADADGPGPAPSRAAMRVVARRRADVVVQRSATSEAEGEEAEGARPAEQLGGPGSRSATAPFVDYAYLPLLFDEAHLAQCECAVAAFARVATPGTAAASLGEEDDVASSASGDGSLDSASTSSSRRRAARAFSFTALRAAWVSARREEWAPWRVRVASRGADAELAALRDFDRGGSRGGGGVSGFGFEKQRGAKNGSEGGPPKDPNPGDASDAFACVVGDADASASSASASSASPSAEDESSRPVCGLEGATREAKARRRRMRDGERDEKKASAFGAFFGAFRSGVGTATDSRREDAYRVGGGGASEAAGGSSRSRLAALASRLGGGLGGSDSDSRGGFRRRAVFEDDLHGAPWDVPIVATEVVVGEAAKDETLSRSAVDPAELAVSPEEGEEEPEDGVGGSRGAGGGGVLGCSPGGESSANSSANPSADPPDPPDPAEVERAERTSRRRGRLSARGAVRGSGAPNGLATSEPRARRTATEETEDASESSESSESSPPSPHLVVLVHGFDGSLQDLRLVRAHLALVAPHATCVVSASNRGRTSTSSVAEMGARLAEETARAAKEAFDEPFPFHEDEKDRREDPAVDGGRAGTAASVVSSSPRALPRVRVSFAAHSLGCLIVRAALAHPAMAPFLDALHFFLSISGPHLGYASPICTARCVPVSGRERSCSPFGGSSRALSVSCSPFALGLRALRRLRPRATCLREAALADATRAEDCYLYRLAREPRGLALFRHVVLCSSPQDGYVERESARVEARAEEEEEEASRAPTKSGKSRGDDARRKSRKRLFRARREMALAMLEPVLAKARAPAPGEMDHHGEEAGVSSASRGASRGFRTTLARVDVLFPPGKGASLASCVGRKAHIDFLETQEWVRFVLWGHREKFT